MNVLPAFPECDPTLEWGQGADPSYQKDSRKVDEGLGREKDESADQAGMLPTNALPSSSFSSPIKLPVGKPFVPLRTTLSAVIDERESKRTDSIAESRDALR